MADGPLDLNPDRVSQLLHAEAQGQIPEPWKPVLEKLRASGTLPPALPGGSQLWGGQLASGKATSAYKPEIPPPPTMSRLGSAAAEIPGAVDAAKSGMKTVGKAALDTMADPEALASTAGGIIGGAVGNAPGAFIGAGMGGAAVAGVREHLAATRENRPESIAPAASSFVTGAAAEGAGRALPRIFSSEMTPMGAKVAGQLGDKAMIPDLVNSPGWDFARNVAREGFLGRGKMLGREQENAGTMLGKVTQRAERELPPLQIPKVQPMLNPDKTMAGREAQDQLRDQFVTKTGEGKDLYRTFMGQHGNTPIQTGPTSATPLRNLHAERSAALEDARAAAGSNDYKSQMEAMRRVHRISDMIDAADPALAARYNDISRQYGQIMEQFDNPVVRSLREKVPAENLVDVMLHPDKLNTFAPFRENTTVTGRSIPAHQSVSQEDAVHMVRAALGEDKFRQLRADTIMQMGQAARSSEHGTIEGLQGRELVGQLKKLPPGVQTALFGPGTSQALNDIAEVTAHTQRTRSGTGALWIVMRQPSEMLKVGGGVMGAAGLAAGSGYKTGHEDLGLTTAGAILLSPLVLSNILRSSTATKLFVRAIGSQPTVKAKILQRLATQIPAEAIREQTPYADGGNDLGNGLPNPPGQ